MVGHPGRSAPDIDHTEPCLQLWVLRVMCIGLRQPRVGSLRNPMTGLAQSSAAEDDTNVWLWLFIEASIVLDD